VEESGIKTTFPQISCHITLQKVSVQLYSLLYSIVNSVRSDAKRFNYGKYSRETLFLCLSTQINLQHVFIMPAFGTHACFQLCTPLVYGCVNGVLLNAMTNIYLHK